MSKEKQQSKTRIYVTKGPDSNEELVDAGTKAQSIRHVTTGLYSAKVASQQDIVRLLGKGKKVQKAGAEEEE